MRARVKRVERRHEPTRDSIAIRFYCDEKIRSVFTIRIALKRRVFNGNRLFQSQISWSIVAGVRLSMV